MDWERKQKRGKNDLEPCCHLSLEIVGDRWSFCTLLERREDPWQIGNPWMLEPPLACRNPPFAASRISGIQNNLTNPAVKRRIPDKVSENPLQLEIPFEIPANKQVLRERTLKKGRFQTLMKRGISKDYIKAIQFIHKGAIRSSKTIIWCNAFEFPFGPGLHWASTLGPLFIRLNYIDNTVTNT